MYKVRVKNSTVYFMEVVVTWRVCYERFYSSSEHISSCGINQDGGLLTHPVRVYTYYYFSFKITIINKHIIILGKVRGNIKDRYTH